MMKVLPCSFCAEAMHLLIVLTLCMASGVRGAPVPGKNAPIGDQQFQDVLQDSRSLTRKILQVIPEAHRACVISKTLQLNSPENNNLATLASMIGIPAAPALCALSENCTVSEMLRRMSEGLQLHKGLLNSISPRLEVKENLTELIYDIDDLSDIILKMLKLAQKDVFSKPAPVRLELRLSGQYEVQVATHLTLVQLQAFGQDMDRCFRSLDQGHEEEERLH